MGIVTQPTTDFQLNGKEANFIFANMDGSISAWNGGGTSTITATVTGGSFTGLAIGNLPGGGGGPDLRRGPEQREHRRLQ